MSALTILIIRHAEKPGEAWPGPGLTAEGTPGDKSLVLRGWQRAGAWAARFGAEASADYPRPAAIYAANPDTAAEGEPSRRHYETVQPLANRLHLAPIVKWARGEEAGLVGEVAKSRGVVLIAWEHKRIAEAIVPALLAGQQLPGVPAGWDRARFDVVLRFDRPAAGAPWSFRQLFPCLLAGDSDTPL
ncbi:MAG: histidine phosphatase family protein [Alphaproteobacteria bacterium]|nr:histidine phosphatase family protein [Alphaproteobacteria bacterium]